MPEAELDVVLDAFRRRCAGIVDFAELPDWADRVQADRPLWANRRRSWAGRRAMLDIGTGSGLCAVLAAHDVPELACLTVANALSPATETLLGQLGLACPARVEYRVGDIGSQLARIARQPARRFDLIRISPAAGGVPPRLLLLEALRLATPEALILVEGVDGAAVNRAVIEILADGAAHTPDIAGWQHVPEQVVLRPGPRPSGRAEPARVILVSVVGPTVQREWALSRPGIAAYAARVGAELIEITEEMPAPLNLLAKMVALDRLDRAGRVLLLDTDTVVGEDAPDLFDLVPVDAVGMFLEGFHIDRLKELRKSIFWYGATARRPFYGNSGVLLLPEPLVSRFRYGASDTILRIDEMYEQGYFNALLHRLGFPVFNLSPLFNCMPAVTPEHRGEAYFVHFAGGSLGQVHLKSWKGAHDAGTGRTVLQQQDLAMKDLRPADIRNQIHAARGRFDHLVLPSHLNSDRGLLMIERGFPVMRYARSNGLLSWGPYLTLAPGTYALSLLLSSTGFRAALFDGIVPTPSESAPVEQSTELEFELTGEYATEVIVPRGRHRVAADGTIRVDFALDHAARNVECRIFGRDTTIALYGLRFRRHPPGVPALSGPGRPASS